MGYAKSLTAILVAVYLTSQCLAQPTHIPHEDPSKVKETLSPLWLLTYYGNVLSLMSSEDYANALNLIGMMNLTYMPSNVKYVVERFNSLLEALAKKLNQTEDMLTQASTLLNAYRLTEAKSKLEEAGITLGSANITLIELEQALGELAGKVGVFTSPAGSKVREAYNKLVDLTLKLRTLWLKYLELLRSLRNEASVVEALELKETRLDIWLSRTEAWVGETVEVYGSLTSGGLHLPDRLISITLGGSVVSTIYTNGSGAFTAKLEIPHIYVSSLTVKAVYRPQGEDVRVYRPCESRELTIKILFHRVELKVEHPSKVYPGRSFEVRGYALTETGGPVYGLTVKASLAGVYDSTSTGSDGYFKLSIRADPRLHVGIYKLTVESNPMGIYAPGHYAGSLEVVKAKLKLTVSAPSIIVIPANVQIEGEATSELEIVKGVTITAILADSLNATRLSDGSFNLSLNIPISPMLSGMYTLTVNAYPEDPWNQSATYTASILIVNPVNAILALAASIPIAIMAFKSVKTRRRAVEAFKKPEVMPEAAPIIVKPPQALEGDWAPVLECYLKALDAISKAFKLSPEPSETLREFLNRIKPTLKGLTVYFGELTSMVEFALYSPTKPSRGDFERAESLVDKMVGGLFED